MKHSALLAWILSNFQRQLNPLSRVKDLGSDIFARGIFAGGFSGKPERQVFQRNLYPYMTVAFNPLDEIVSMQ